MTPDLTDLAQRAVACKGWKWLPGMRWWTDDDRGQLDDFQPEYMGHPDGALPDLSDDATLGCLLSLVRETWYGLHISLECRLVAHDQFEWTITGFVDPKIIPFYAFRGRGPSQAEALVAALEAAP